MVRSLHTYETVKALTTKNAFRKAYARNSREQSKLTDAFIASGRGHWRAGEVGRAAMEGDKMAIQQLDLYAEARALGYHADHWFGQPPYMI